MLNPRSKYQPGSDENSLGKSLADGHFKLCLIEKTNKKTNSLVVYCIMRGYQQKRQTLMRYR